MSPTFFLSIFFKATVNQNRPDVCKLTLEKEIWVNSHFRRAMENLLTGMSLTMATQVSKNKSTHFWCADYFVRMGQYRDCNHREDAPHFIL